MKDKYWAIPAGVYIPESRFEINERNAIWMRDYQDNKCLISQGICYLKDCEIFRLWQHEIAVSQEMDAEHQHRLKCEFEAMCAHFDMDGRV